MMYLDHLAESIRRHIPSDRLPDGDSGALLRLYAVLLRAKGTNVTESDVHDAWSAWMAARDAQHDSLRPYDELAKNVQQQDSLFVAAIRAACEDTGYRRELHSGLSEVLYPAGPPVTEQESREAFELYKIMVQSSESLVSRRQGVNTFFLTINGALLTASGLLVQGRGEIKLAAAGIVVLAVAGALLCLAWRSLITSFGQLNSGKFRVINAMERHFAAAIYAAEWEALGRGEDPKIYRSFTSREIWVPTALLVLHLLTALVGVLVATGWLVIKT